MKSLMVKYQRQEQFYAIKVVVLILFGGSYWPQLDTPLSLEIIITACRGKGRHPPTP